MMKTNSIKRPLSIIGLTIAVGFLLTAGFPPAAVDAGVPLRVSKMGLPFTWRVGRGIPWTPDQGNLASGVDNGRGIEMVQAAFQVWGDVSTARLRFRQDGQLSQDVRSSNAMSFLNGIIDDCLNGIDCVNPIVFDPDGRVTDALQGRGARNTVAGFAAPLVFVLGTGQYIQGYAVLNGLFRTDLEGTMIHEFGHFLGLGHSQLNAFAAFDFDRRNDDIVPTMFPFLTSDSETLHLDDEAAISMLYPDVPFVQQRGTIAGRILLPDGTGFQGANVIARNVDDPELTAVTSVSGFLHTGNRADPDNFGSDDPELLGFYEIRGLPPGFYTVEVDQIRFSFTEGSSVGPLDPPVSLPGPPEFYSGDAESATDDPSSSLEVEVVAGSRTDDIDIILNTDEAPASPSGLGRVKSDGARR